MGEHYLGSGKMTRRLASLLNCQSGYVARTLYAIFLNSTKLWYVTKQPAMFPLP